MTCALRSILKFVYEHRILADGVYNVVDQCIHSFFSWSWLLVNSRNWGRCQVWNLIRIKFLIFFPTCTVPTRSQLPVVVDDLLRDPPLVVEALRFHSWGEGIPQLWDSVLEEKVSNISEILFLRRRYPIFWKGDRRLYNSSFWIFPAVACRVLALGVLLLEYFSCRV